MLVSFGVCLLTLVAIVGGIIQSSERFDYVKVISCFQWIDFIFRTFVCCVDDAIKLFRIDYVDFYSNVLSKGFYIGQVISIVVDFDLSFFI